MRKGDDGWYITYEHCKARTPEDRVGRFFIQEASSFSMALSLYMKQRGSLKTDRLFVQSTQTKFKSQPVGINTLYTFPNLIAEFMGYPGHYTGHAFRRSSATAAAEGGASLLQMQTHFGWRSSSMPQRYVDGSERMQHDISNAITQVNRAQQRTQNVHVTLELKSTDE